MEKSNISDVIDSLIIIPDTNILLYLYKCSFNSSQNIVELLNKVKDKVLVPSRVYKEYMAHKDEEQAKIDRKYDNFTKELKNQVKELKGKIKGRISESRKYGFPDCDTLETGINTLLDNTVQTISMYESSLLSEKQNKSVQIASVEQLLQFWDHQEKIMKEPDICKIMEYVREGEFRYRYKIPPGYMDEEEKDKEIKKDGNKDSFENRIRKYGDLFVWKEVISIGKKILGEKTILFLTNDVKEDWWVLKGEQNSKEAVRMRDELYKEFYEEVGNNKIEFITLSNFYEAFSQYYKICDIKTALELDIDLYIRGYILSKYQLNIEEHIKGELEKIDLEEINPEYYDAIMPLFAISDMSIKEINLHYDDAGETAIYDLVIKAITSSESVLRNDGETISWLVDLELEITLLAQVQRDLNNLEDDGLVFSSFYVGILSEKDAWDIYMEAEGDLRMESNDAAENYYNH